jgi:hypothetical protein
MNIPICAIVVLNKLYLNSETDLNLTHFYENVLPLNDILLFIAAPPHYIFLMNFLPSTVAL